MPLELGERLVEVGLVTRSQLSRHGVVAHGAALVKKLVGAGLMDEALAGFFSSEGFGPLLERRDLFGADPVLVARLPAEMAWEFLVLPLRETPSGVMVAMAAPSDRHVVRETTRLLGTNILPTATRYADLIAVLKERLPLPSTAPEERHDSEPPVLQLVRRRDPKASSPTLAATSSAPLREAPPPPPTAVPVADDDEPLPLVRHKPIASKPAMVIPAVEPAPGPSPGPGPRPSPVPSVVFSKPAAPTNKLGAVVQKSFPAPVTRDESAAAFRAGAERKTTTSEYEVGARKAEGKLGASLAPPVADPAPAVAEPVASSIAAPVAGPETAAPDASEAETNDAPLSVLPPPNDRWDLPAQQPKPDGKISASRASLPSSKAAAGDIAPMLTSMKSARDRDAIVRLACEGAVTVARSAVFLALRKGVLKGWDGAGQGVSRDSVRNLWIPAGSESMFKRVIDSGAPFVGAYGQGIADGLFRAAVGSRGGDVAVWPVSLEGKIVGLLCVDDLRPGSISRHRIETLTVSIAEGFRRLINTGKSE